MARFKQRLPSFIIAGAARSGTTTLWDVLRSHPDIFMPDRKELGFFLFDDRFERGVPAYAEHFAAATRHSVVGEATPMYFLKNVLYRGNGHYYFTQEDDSARRIARSLPDVRIVISLRHPVTRAQSQFWKNRRTGSERARTLLEAIAEEKRGERHPSKSACCWLYRNQYALHLDHWRSLFPRENLHIMIFEEWVAEPQSALRGLFRFLSVSDVSIPEKISPRNTGYVPRSRTLNRLLSKLPIGRSLAGKISRYLNRGSGYPPLSPVELREASAEFEDDIAYVEALLGRHLACWHL